MRGTTTESLHQSAPGLDLKTPEAVLSDLLEGQSEAAASVAHASDAIIEASAAVAHCLRSGGSLFYAAAGSSGLMALSDALELPGTFGIERDRIKILFAGGSPWIDTFRGGPEDDSDLGFSDATSAGIGKGDLMIAVSASGSTPYAVAALARAAEVGATTVAIANNPDTPLLKAADIGIFLPTSPELIAGSTRMGAGTAQKIALNMISTLMAIDLGHVVDGHMVNLTVDNTKLRTRAIHMICRLAKCDETRAANCLDEVNGKVKPAILRAAGAGGIDEAQALLDAHDGNVRSALTALDQGSAPEEQRASSA
ncbi:N-acetylmuramic acid 6-phosphate etherase [Hoeflea prorocentri]|uniref:N-acetylmuramic acid 6-phosphate etherase n=1 Tax=Hoeflea prorocentri TaxID=1922333 RepID=A0A9X3UH86_9HYPH|nr:N-acetylmuramic acid 6-phosphate etherase [Hoeflea prorocentri]MCY6381302.1 N-acetylmuramic acid 6-phosphate etherase [Hoeflea prorocentri]MDA5399102.1 N-acetylmuramic acid 6-phosphate etherase [Hoeflea prorocentri]